MCTAQIFPAWVKYVWKYLLVGVIFWWAKREDLLSVLHVYGSILRNLRGLFFSSFPLKSTNCSSWESLAGVNPQLFSRWRTSFQKVLCIFWRDSWETAGGLWVLSTMNEEKKYRVWWECGILLLWSLDVPFLKQKVGEVLQMLVFVHVWGNYWVFWGTKKKKKVKFRNFVFLSMLCVHRMRQTANSAVKHEKMEEWKCLYCNVRVPSYKYSPNTNCY